MSAPTCGNPQNTVPAQKENGKQHTSNQLPANMTFEHLHQILAHLLGDFAHVPNQGFSHVVTCRFENLQCLIEELLDLGCSRQHILDEMPVFLRYSALHLSNQRTSFIMIVTENQQRTTLGQVQSASFSPLVPAKMDPSSVESMAPCERGKQVHRLHGTKRDFNVSCWGDFSLQVTPATCWTHPPVSPAETGDVLMRFVRHHHKPSQRGPAPDASCSAGSRSSSPASV